MKQLKNLLVLHTDTPWKHNHGSTYIETMVALIERTHENQSIPNYNIQIHLFPAWGKMILAFRVRKPLRMGTFMIERIFQSTPNGILMAHTEWLPMWDWSIQYHLCRTYRGCGGWWLSGCRGSVEEHWRLKPEVSWVWLPGVAGFFHFLLFSPHNIQIHLPWWVLKPIFNYGHWTKKKERIRKIR